MRHWPSACHCCLLQSKHGRKIHHHRAPAQNNVTSNPKTNKNYYEYKETVDEAEVAATPQQDDHSGTATSNSSSLGDVQNSQELKICTKYAKVVLGATVRWQRRIKQKVKEGGSNVGGKRDDEEEDKAKHVTRKLSCTRCLEPHDTCRMQLRTTGGYRDITLQSLWET